MATPTWGRVPQDEEAINEPLNIEEPVEPRATRGRWVGAIVLTALVGMVVVVGWSSGQLQHRSTIVPPEHTFAMKSEVHSGGVDPEQASMRYKSRPKLRVEASLSAELVRLTKDGRNILAAALSNASPDRCQKQAGWVFDEFVQQTKLVDELHDTERKAFKQRFITSMEVKCKEGNGMQWLEAAGKEIENQKPVMTTAWVESINRAGLGFQAKMHDWLLHDSEATIHQHFGFRQTPKGQPSVFNRGRGLNAASDLPTDFQAEEKWPKCKEAIRRIHNQGACGSCWAFGSTASIDARLCIATQGKFDSSRDVLSRLEATSCAAEMQEGAGADGCQGGWPHWPMLMMAQRGLVSSSCLPYYIGGEGVEHFDHQEFSPPCRQQNHCQGGYNMTMQQDLFWAPGIEQYDWITEVHGDSAKMLTMRTAIYEEGPVSFAFYANRPFMAYSGGVFSVCTAHDRANHAVYASGWGELDGTEYIQASNSWGENWGLQGRFLLHPLCVTDVVIAGSIHSPDVHRVADVDVSVARDPNNPQWPWEPIPECPFVNNCVTDVEGGSDYANGELCVSNALNGKQIEVVEFDTEKSYDVLTVNGFPYSGDKERVLSNGLDGVVVSDDGIKFESDGSVVAGGFKLCAK